MTLRINSFNSSHSVFQRAQKFHAKKNPQKSCSKLQSKVAKRTINSPAEPKKELEEQLTVEVKAWLEAKFPNHPDIEALGDLISKLTRNPEHLAGLKTHLIRSSTLAKDFFESFNKKELIEINNLINQLEEVEADIVELQELQDSRDKLGKIYRQSQRFIKPHA